MAGSITNLEIFATGTFKPKSGKVTVTDEDLDKIVDAFSSLTGSNIVKPHLKLGHTDAQKWFGQIDGIPALGWITRVWRQGRKLFADITDVPDELIGLIKSNRFHNVSAEIFWDANIEHAGRRFSRVLGAVSLLGVEMPAVKDLAGLQSALFQTEPIHQFSEAEPVSLINIKGDDPMPGNDDKKGKEATFSQKQVDALISAETAQVETDLKAQFKSDNDSKDKELEVMTSRAETAEKDLATVKLEAATIEATTLVDAAIKEGKLLPKQKEFAMAFLGDNDSKIKFGEGEKSRADLFKDFLDAAGKQVKLSENGSGENHQKTFSNVSEEVDHKVKAFMAKESKPYDESFDKVMALDEDLKKRYSEATA